MKSPNILSDIVPVNNDQTVGTMWSPFKEGYFNKIIMSSGAGTNYDYDGSSNYTSMDLPEEEIKGAPAPSPWTSPENFFISGGSPGYWNRSDAGNRPGGHLGIRSGRNSYIEKSDGTFAETSSKPGIGFYVSKFGTDHPAASGTAEIKFYGYDEIAVMDNNSIRVDRPLVPYTNEKTNIGDASHKFNEAYIKNVKGNADTTSKLKTAVSLTTTDGIHTSDGADFDGSAPVSIKLPTTITATFSGNLTGDVSGNATTATTAEKLGTSAGDTAKPIYFKDGKPAETGYTFADTISSSATDNNKKLPTSSAVVDYVGSTLRASDAMIYKGTIGTGGTVEALPSTTALTGWTYKVITAGTYAGVSCEVGDMIICLTDGSSSQAATWTVVQANIDGAVTSGVTSATDGHIPLFSGTTGKVIKSSSKAIVTSITDTDSENIPTDKAVKAFVEGKKYVTSSGVTSVGLSLPDIFSVTGSPVTSTGTLTGTLNTQSKNTVFAGPSSGNAAAPTFRKLVATDLPGTYAGSSSAGGTALTSEKLEGFSKSDSQSWGVQAGAFVHGEEVASANEGAGGCCWAFRKDCPDPGLISLFVDGKFYQDEGRYACIDTNGGTITGGLSVEGITSFTNEEASTDISTGAVKITGGLGVGGDIYAGAVHNAVWNDLADCIPVDDECKVEPGYCYCFDGEKYYKATKYLDEGIVGIDSDTYGMSMGHKSGLNQMDVAVAGFVLAYVDKEYKPGTPLTCTENGYLTEVRREDKIEYPERIVATYWKSEPADEWGSDDRKVKVNGRKWVKVI